MGPYTHERSRELKFDGPAPLGAIPLADRPVEPLRGKLSQVTSAKAEVTNLKQDLTSGFAMLNAFISLSVFLLLHLNADAVQPLQKDLPN